MHGTTATVMLGTAALKLLVAGHSTKNDRREAGKRVACTPIADRDPSTKASARSGPWARPPSDRSFFPRRTGCCGLVT